jgi:hypothetical protein
MIVLAVGVAAFRLAIVSGSRNLLARGSGG